MGSVNGARELVNEIGSRWKADFVEKAKAPDKNNPNKQDYDDYASPLLVVAEMLRKQPGFKGLAHSSSAAPDFEALPGVSIVKDRKYHPRQD